MAARSHRPIALWHIYKEVDLNVKCDTPNHMATNYMLAQFEVTYAFDSRNVTEHLCGDCFWKVCKLLKSWDYDIVYQQDVIESS